MMRFHLFGPGLLAIFLSVCLVVVANAQVNQQPNYENPEDGGRQLVPSARSLFVMPKFFDFNTYTSMFNKHYQSLVQALARQKLFMAKAFKAFISGIKYIYRKSDYYCSINQLSDQTPEELAKRVNRRNRQVPVDSEGVRKRIEAVDRADVERELEHILESHENEPGLREMAEQISKTAGRRKRRNADSSLRDVSLDQLLRPTVNATKSEKMVRSVPTNNPNYEPVELMSFGTNPDRVEPEIPGDEVSFINGLPGASYVRSMRDGLLAAFNWNNEVSVGTKLTSRRLKSEEDKEVDLIHSDLRRTKCFHEVQDQGRCGSCYIFSTLSLLEWAYCMQTGKLVKFSEQYAIDCGFRAGLQGCNGGYEKDVVDFVRKYGLELLLNYPYKASEGTCPYPRNTNSEVMGYMKVKEINLGEVLTFDEVERILTDTPLLSTINIPFDFSDYGGGVHQGEECQGEEGEHAMLLIGHGRQDGQEYWLFRNSYDATWGERGHFKLSKKSACLQPTSLTLESRIGNKNSLYKSFRLSRKHDQRDPDAPIYSTPPVALPVNDRGEAPKTDNSN